MQPGLVHAPDRDTFAVYAPDATAVELVLLSEEGGETRLGLTADEAGSGDWATELDPLPPGARYGLRAHGPFDPEHGRVFDPSLLLLDPYARAVSTHEGRPVAVAVDRDVDAGGAWAGHARPRVAAADRVLAEVHVRGYTRTHPHVPERLRGTYAALAEPAVTDHLRGLGITTVELLPIHHFLDETRLTRQGLVNFWGYNSAAFFAPHAGYSSEGSRGGQVADVKAMVAGLHAAGLEVVLDVVYNHTSEQGLDGPTTGLRGLADAATYRRVNADGSGAYLDTTGCGNTLDTTHPRTLALVMDSLRYWLGEVGVDGFRFDLASALARTSTARGSAFDPLSPLLSAIAQDPLCRQAVLIAEPWDVAAGGYQLGSFGPRWAEWNDRFRDTSRQFWRRVPGAPDGVERRQARRRVEPAAAVRDLASRLAGSSDVFAHSGRGPLGSVNFVTAHDGFTLADLVSHDVKHNRANGEDDRDGTTSNHSWNHGAEGPTADPAILAARLRTARNLLGTTILAAGTPMLLGGDETGRTQGGNNNAYCLDDPLTWVDWSWLGDGPAADPGVPAVLPPGAAADLLAWTTGLLRLRASLALLRPTQFLRGEGATPDLLWLRTDGSPVAPHDWWAPARQTLGMLRLPAPDRPGAGGPALLLWLHAEDEEDRVRLPDPATAAGGLGPSAGWAVLADSATGMVDPAATGPLLPPGASLGMTPRSLRLLTSVPVAPAVRPRDTRVTTAGTAAADRPAAAVSVRGERSW